MCLIREYVLTFAALLICAAILAPACRPGGEAPNPVCGVLVNQPSWPTDRGGLLFCYENRGSIFAIGAGDKPREGYGMGPTGLSRRGLVMTDRDGALWLVGGSFIARGVSEHLARAFRRGGEFTIGARITPGSTHQISDAEIISFASRGGGGENFRILQRGGRIVLSLTTSSSAGRRMVDLLELKDAAPFQLAVTYRPGLLVCYRDGGEVLRNTLITGDLGNWRSEPLVFGDAYEAGSNWFGKLDGIALYARALAPAEIGRNYQAYLRGIRARKHVAVVRIRAKLIERSSTGPRSGWDPYFRTLTIYRYRVEKVLRGKCDHREICVAHWCIVNNTVLPFSGAPLGGSYALTLERFIDNRQLEGEKQNFTLSEESFDLPWYYDAGGLSLTWKPPR